MKVFLGGGRGYEFDKTMLSFESAKLLLFSYSYSIIYLFIYLLFSHNKDYTSITLYKDVARGPQKTTRLVRGGPLVTIILSNRTITTHNNGQYKTHYRYSRKSKTFVLNDCMLNETEMEIAIRLLTLALNNNNNIYNYENYIKISKGMTKY